MNPPKKPIPDLDAQPEAAYNWFPGHMMKAMREIKTKVGNVDLVIEIRDARVPIVSGNSALHEIIGNKARLILLNKVNLANPTTLSRWEKWFEDEKVPFLFINCLDKGIVKTVMAKARKIVQERRQVTSAEKVEVQQDIRIMIVGLPNTGKSTFINQISQRNAAKVANKPGETRHNLWILVDDHIKLLDTPGIMPPQIRSQEHRMWLSLINAIPDEIVGEEEPSTYLVKYLLKNKVEAFKSRYKLDSFDLSVDEVYQKIASVRGCLRQGGLPDLERVYKIVLADFRSGDLGKVSFGL